MATLRPANTTPFQERLYAMLSPIADQDANNNWALLNYCGAIAAMYDQIWSYVKDGQQGEPGWSVLLDTTRIPIEAVPWLAEVTGTMLRTSRQEIASYRNLLKDPSFEGTVKADFTNISAPAVLVNHELSPTWASSGTKSYHGKATGFVGGAGSYGYWYPYQYVSGNGILAVPGRTYGFRARLNALTLPVGVNTGAGALFWNAVAGAGTAVVQAVDHLGVQDIVAVGKAGPNDSWFSPVVFTASTVGDFEFYIDDMLIIELPEGSDVFDVPPFFYGSTPNVGGQYGRWTGTPNESISELVRLENNQEYLDRLRSQVRNAAGLKRGTLGAMREAIRQQLTGGQTVILKERDGSAYKTTVVTYTDETPSQVAVQNAIKSQKPGGIVVDFFVVPGTTYVTIRASYTDYLAVRSSFLTYNGLRNNQPGT